MTALVLCLLAGIWLKRTTWGFEVRATGSGITAARLREHPWIAGRDGRSCSAGPLPGLAGALETVAVHHRFYRAFSPGYGFDGITAAFLVNADPGWLWLSSLLLASLRSADKWLQLSLGVSPSSVLVIQAVLLLAAACRPVFHLPFARRFQKSLSAETATHRASVMLHFICSYSAKPLPCSWRALEDCFRR